MPLWTPSSLSSLVGWWDPSDSSTVTDNAGKCDQLDDKSANGNDLVKTGATGPTITSASINDLDVLTFSAGNTLEKDGASSLPGLSTGIGFGAVIAPTNLSTKVAISLGDHTNTANESLLFFYSGGNAILRTKNSSGTQSTKSYSDTTNPHLFSGTCSAALRDLYIDGTQGTAQSTGQTDQSSPDISLGHQLGATTVNDLLGRMGEVVLFSGSSSTDRQIVEGYLAWKWGLVARLASGHPYKSTPPIIEGGGVAQLVDSSGLVG